MRSRTHPSPVACLLLLLFGVLACLCVPATVWAQDEPGDPPVADAPKPRAEPKPPEVISAETFEASDMEDLATYLRPFTHDEILDVALWAQQVARARSVVMAHERIWLDTKPEDEREAAMETLMEAMKRREDAVARMDLAVDLLEEKGGDVERLRAYSASLSAVKLQLDESTGEILTAWLTWRDGGVKLLKNIAWAIAFGIGAWLFSRLCGFLMAILVRVAMRKSGDMFRHFVVGGVRNLVLVGGVLFGLQLVGVDIGHMLAAAGIVGFVLAFALQGIIGNFAAGLMLLVYRPFDVGDYVEAAGVAGTVRRLRMVSTELASIDNQLLVVPNGKLWGDVIRNKNGYPTRRIDLVFRVALDTDVERAMEVLREVVGADSRILPEPAVNICVGGLSEFAVDLYCRPWAKTPDYWDTRWDLTRAVHARFAEEGIKIPVPQRELIVHSGTPAT